jgi:adenylate cyclase
LNDLHGLAVALHHAGELGYRERNPMEVERLASELIELSTRQNFTHFRGIGAALLGWARSASGLTAQGVLWIEDGVEELRASGTVLGMVSSLTLKAEAFYLADRTSEALETIKEAEAMVEASEARGWSAELYRLRGVFLARLGADETQIEGAFREAIRTAKEQKSISWMKRAEATYAEYRSQKASGLGGRGFRLPLC